MTRQPSRFSLAVFRALRWFFVNFIEPAKYEEQWFTRRPR